MAFYVNNSSQVQLDDLSNVLVIVAVCYIKVENRVEQDNVEDTTVQIKCIFTFVTKIHIYRTKLSVWPGLVVVMVELLIAKPFKNEKGRPLEFLSFCRTFFL